MKASLTGGIATGKTTVAGFFRELGAAIVDADAVSHDVLRWPEIISAISDHFGISILSDDGFVNRSRLGEIVFSDDDARRWLNALIHPSIWREMDRRIRETETITPDTLVIVDIPLLIELGETLRYGPMILAYCTPDIQLQRLIARDQITAREAENRIRSQMPIEAKRRLSNYLIDTSGSFEDTRRKTTEIYRQILTPTACADSH